MSLRHTPLSNALRTQSVNERVENLSIEFAYIEAIRASEMMGESQLEPTQSKLELSS